MNDLTFAATLLSILVTLSSAFYVEVTRQPATRADSSAIAHTNPARVQVARSVGPDCPCPRQTIAQVRAR
jgi:hypothetical protein